MRKILACVLAISLVLCISGISVMAETDYSGLIEECLTTEVKTAISKNLTMISSWNDTPITWESSAPAVISADGTVTRGVSDKTVTLTAIADGTPVKTLTYTVLSKYKDVWYNENFYRPTYAGQELIGSSGINSSIKDIEYKHNGSGRIGFYKAAGKGDNTSGDLTSLQVKESPLNASDYALCSTDGTAQKGFYLAFPASMKPSGKVTIQADLCTTGVDKQDTSKYDMHTYIGFNSAASTSVANLQWLATDGFQIRNTANSTIVSQLATAGATTVSSSLKIEIDFDEKTLKLIDSSAGKLVDNSASFTADATLQSIWFYARTGGTAAVNPNISFWLDNIVITTEEHIVDDVTITDGVLNSVTTNSESAAKGYIAVYNNSDMILDVKTFDITEGTAIANNLGYNLPQDYSYCRIFVLDDNIVPLDTVYSNKQ